MEVFISSSPASFTLIPKFKPHKTLTTTSNSFTITINTAAHSKKNRNNKPSSFGTDNNINNNNLFNLSSSSSSSTSCISKSTRTTTATSTTPTSVSPSSASRGNRRHWMVVMDAPPQQLNSKSDFIDYYVKTLERVLGSEKEAQMCIYDASCDMHFGFCCDIDEETSLELSRLPGVLAVRPDPDFNSAEKDYSFNNVQLSPLSSLHSGISPLFPAGTSRHWLVRMKKPPLGLLTKAQVVDYYAQVLAKVLGNEKDAQMCIFDISWQFSYGFCCELDDICAKELAGIPGVLSVQPDEKFESDNKDCGGESLQRFSNSPGSAGGNPPANIKTKKLFVTGLSFYTSEKTLRAAFEGFGELVEVRIIMDKISKRSKGYAFIEYTTEEAASAALTEMNGKIINGWMIVVDVAKKNPTKYSRGCPRSDL
ncbi:hypothetical protein LguiB_035692 [Lonicera macranthoides]